MAELDSIAAEARERVESIGAADLLIGLPACASGESLETVASGLRSAFPKTVLVYPPAAIPGVNRNGDESAPDARVQLLPYPFVPVERRDGRVQPDDLRSVFLIGQKLGTRSCAVLNSDIDSSTPAALRALLEPVLNQGFDLAVPYYARRKFDGLINSAAVYPLTRALYGKRVHYPMAQDLACSARLVGWCLQPASSRPVPLSWMTVNAVCAGLQVCQVSLGLAPPPKDTADLSAVLASVLGSLFQDLDRNVMFWQRSRGSQAVRTFGQLEAAPEESPAVDVRKMIDAFHLGCRDLMEIWAAVLSPATLMELRKLAKIPPDQFRLPDDVWVRLVYDFALGYRQRVMNRDHLLRAMTPAYLAWVASFALEVQDAGPRQVEARLERLCLAFEAQKPYLVSRWRWPDRFNP
ncbi:MAG: hypothetical protein LAP38_05025 [Acidobacteriia bacterium]|nr:hypothetical protein [Terriglobia bacterium]